MVPKASLVLFVLASLQSCRLIPSSDTDPLHPTILSKTLRLRGGLDSAARLQQNYHENRWEERRRELQPLIDAAIEEHERKKAELAAKQEMSNRNNKDPEDEDIQRIDRIFENATRDSVSEFVEENTFFCVDPNENKDFLFNDVDEDCPLNQSSGTNSGKVVQCFWCTDAGIVSKNVTNVRKFMEERKAEERKAREILWTRNHIDCDMDEEIARRIYACEEMQKRKIDVQILDPFNESTWAVSASVKQKLQEMRERNEDLALPVTLSNFTPIKLVNISMVEKMFRQRQEMKPKKEEMVIPTLEGNITVKVANLTPSFRFNYEINDTEWFGIDYRGAEEKYNLSEAAFQEMCDQFKIGPSLDPVHPDVLIANADIQERLFDMSGGAEGSLKKAFRLYRRAVELNDTSARALASLAKFLYRRHGNFTEADRLFQKALHFEKQDLFSLHEYLKMLTKWDELASSKFSSQNFTFIYYLHSQQRNISTRLDEALDRQQCMLTDEEIRQVKKETMQQVEDFVRSGMISLPSTLDEMAADRFNDLELQCYTELAEFDKSHYPHDVYHQLLETLYRSVPQESKEQILAERRAKYGNSTSWNETFERSRLICPLTEKIKDLLRRAPEDAKAARQRDRANRLLQDFHKKFNISEYLLRTCNYLMGEKENLTLQEYFEVTRLLNGNLSQKGYDRLLETASHDQPENLTAIERHFRLWRYAIREDEDPFTLLGDGTGLPLSESEDESEEQAKKGKTVVGTLHRMERKDAEVPEGPLPLHRSDLPLLGPEEEEVSSPPAESKAQEQFKEKIGEEGGEEEEGDGFIKRVISPWNRHYPWRGDRNDVDHLDTAQAIFTCQSVISSFSWICKLCDGDLKLSVLQLVVAQRAHKRFVSICRDLITHKGEPMTRMHELVSDFLLLWNQSVSLQSLKDVPSHGDANMRFHLDEIQMLEKFREVLEKQPLSEHGKDILARTLVASYLESQEELEEELKVKNMSAPDPHDYEENTDFMKDRLMFMLQQTWRSNDTWVLKMEKLDKELEEDELYKLDDQLVLRPKREADKCCLTSKQIKKISDEISSNVLILQLGEQVINCFSGLAAAATHSGFSSIEDYFQARGGENLWNHSKVVEEEILVASMREISSSKKQCDLFIPHAGSVPLPEIIPEHLNGSDWPEESLRPPCEKSHLLPHWWPLSIINDPLAFFAANLIDSVAGMWRGMKFKGPSSYKRRDPESIPAVDILADRLRNASRGGKNEMEGG